jgi:hypothetical protein
MANNVPGKKFGILDLLGHYGFDRNCKAKLVRHADRKRCDINGLIRRDYFDFYQATQSRPVFAKCDRIISCIGIGETKARLIGVYRVIKQWKGRRKSPPKGFPREFGNYHYFYDLRKEPEYKEVENRVVIDWGKGTRSWVQKLRNKEIVEILPKGQVRSPFRDYLEFTLTFAELRELYKNPESTRDWQSRLEAVSGVYLILDTKTGSQYVGSAYGVDGIWGRWKTYAHNGHGGNKQLKALTNGNSAYPEAFTFSILQILPHSFAKCEVIAWEQHYKEKLGSRATGLNCN